MGKWIKSIIFTYDYKRIGMGQGDHREDHMYYSSALVFRSLTRDDMYNIKKRLRSDALVSCVVAVFLPKANFMCPFSLI